MKKWAYGVSSVEIKRDELKKKIVGKDASQTVDDILEILVVFGHDPDYSFGYNSLDEAMKNNAAISIIDNRGGFFEITGSFVCSYNLDSNGEIDCIGDLSLYGAFDPDDVVDMLYDLGLDAFVYEY